MGFSNQTIVGAETVQTTTALCGPKFLADKIPQKLPGKFSGVLNLCLDFHNIKTRQHWTYKAFKEEFLEVSRITFTYQRFLIIQNTPLPHKLSCALLLALFTTFDSHINCEPNFLHITVQPWPWSHHRHGDTGTWCISPQPHGKETYPENLAKIQRRSLWTNTPSILLGTKSWDMSDVIYHIKYIGEPYHYVIYERIYTN